MLKRYKPFFRAGAMDMLAYKFNLLTWLIVTVFEVAVIVFLWVAVYRNSNNGFDSIINGYSFKEMICYLVMINIFTFVCADGSTLWQINDEIKNGTISMSFVKPISYRKRFIATTLGYFFVVTTIVGVPCFTIAYLVFYLIGYIEVTSISIFLLHLVMFFIAQILACLLNDVINYIFGILCFYTSSGWGINQIKNVIVSFLSGSLLPLSFFPGVFGKLLNYLPFAGMANNPVLILLMKFNIHESLSVIGLSLFWLVILEFIAFILFKHASKKITVHGG
jgi:ABC-2 type transport system permease protein